MRLRNTRTVTLARAIALLSISTWFSFASRAADILPAQLADAEYWKLITDYSEPDKYFQQRVITSNEVSYQQVVPALVRTAKSGGVYFGVGPEQNFTYIAAVQPKIAFLIDIRREMMLEHLMYKSIFEMSADRLQFVSTLFARKPLAQLTGDSPVDTIFQSLTRIPLDRALAEENANAIVARLKTRHRFPLTAADEAGIRDVYLTFVRAGVVSFSASFLSPGYMRLMTLTDRAGKNWSFLATAENYNRVRALHQKNMIVPLVGDFGGPKAIRLAGQYVKDHGAIVNVFYLSNVEDYIAGVWGQYASNISSLPIDSSSVFIRWFIGGSPALSSIADFVRTQRPEPRIRE